MDLFTYLMAKNGNNTSVHGDLFSYLLGKGQSQTYTISGVTIYISNAKKLVNFIMTKESTQATSILPDGYTQVDYIESSGTQYIDTGCTFSAKQLIDFKINWLNNDGLLYFGANSSSKELMLAYRDYPSSTPVNYFGGQFTYTFNTNTDYHIVMDFKNTTDNIILNINDVEVKNTSTTSDGANEKKIYLFGGIRVASATTIDSYVSAKIYFMKITDPTGNLIRNFIPCYRNSDNEVGLYDLVNDVFYTNQGTGAFTYGSVAQLPNPDFPIEVETVKGYRNLFNESNSKKGYYIDKSGNEISNSNYYISNYIMVKPNETITFSGNTIIINTYAAKACFYDKNKNFISYNNIIIGTNLYIVPNNAEYFRTSISTTNINDVSIEDGNNYVDVNVTGKNLLNNEHDSKSYGGTNWNYNNGELKINGTGSSDTIVGTTLRKVNIRSNTPITFSLNYISGQMSGGGVQIGFRFVYDDNTTSDVYSNNQTDKFTADNYLTKKIIKHTFTPSKDVIGIYLHPYVTYFTGTDFTGTVQLEEGSTATAYEPYQSATVSIPLNNNEIVGIGNYKDELIVDSEGHCYLNKVIAKKVFDGSEGIGLGSSNYPGRFFLRNLWSNNYPATIGLSNYFKRENYDSAHGGYTTMSDGSFSIQGSIHYLWFIKLDNPTVAEFKEWLQTLYNNGTPVILYYKPDSSTLIDLNTTVNLKLFKGVNNVSNSVDGYMTIEYH